MTANSVAMGLALVRKNVASLAAELKADPAPTLVAVSKLMPVETLMLAYNENQRHFGENYVQEICEKAPQMPEDIRWHFIGGLQSNKAKMLVNSVKGLYMVESVDSPKLATTLDKACEAAKRDVLRVLVQVNTSKEESKGGCEDHEALAVAKHIVDTCKNLRFSGLMTIGKLGDPNPEPYFKKLAECRADVAKKLGVEEKSLLLSMGMSGDYELAIRMGSNNVRVGSTIFGERPQKQPTNTDTATTEQPSATTAPPAAAPAPPSSAAAPAAVKSTEPINQAVVGAKMGSCPFSGSAAEPGSKCPFAMSGTMSDDSIFGIKLPAPAWLCGLAALSAVGAVFVLRLRARAA
jgi:pyridoxal phosphate enzyme (YggS family)